MNISEEGKRHRDGSMKHPVKAGEFDFHENEPIHDDASLTIQYHPIGVIHTPFKTTAEAPSQYWRSGGAEGSVRIFEKYRQGLEGLEKFSRAPRRPNPVGVSVVRIMKIQNGTIFVKDVDMLDGTPLLDVKPYPGDLDGPKER